MLTIPDIDKNAIVRITAFIYETIRAAPGTYEIPTLCKIVESKSIYNARAVHCVVDLELSMNRLDLDMYNRIYLAPCTAEQPATGGYVGPRSFTSDPIY